MKHNFFNLGKDLAVSNYTPTTTTLYNKETKVRERGLCQSSILIAPRGVSWINQRSSSHKLIIVHQTIFLKHLTEIRKKKTNTHSGWVD